MESGRQKDNRLLIVTFGDGCVGMFYNEECIYFNDLDDFRFGIMNIRYDVKMEIRLPKKWPSLSCLTLIKG
jgi:hypothetical protein